MKKTYTMINKCLIIFISTIIISCSSAEQQKDAHIKRGEQLLEQDKYNKARIELKNAQQIAPKDSRIYNLLGQIEEKRNEYRAALQHYLKAIKLNPELHDARYRAANFYLMQAISYKAQQNEESSQKSIKQAKEHIEYILEKEKHNLNALTLKYSILSYEGKFVEAKKGLSQLISANSSQSDAIIILVRILKNEGNFKKAQKVLEQGLISQPNNINLLL